VSTQSKVAFFVSQQKYVCIVGY